MLRDSISDVESDIGAAAAVPARPRRSKRTNLFGGREDLARVYKAAKDLIIRHKLLVLKQYEEVDGIKRLTICNLWRIERHPDQSTRAFEFDLRAGTWEVAKDLYSWPDIPIWPMSVTSRPNYWPGLIRSAVWKALIAAGFNDLPERHRPWSKKVWERHVKKWAKKGYECHTYGGVIEWSFGVVQGRRRRERFYLSKKQTKALGLDVPKGYTAEMAPAGMARSLIKAYTVMPKKAGTKGWLRKESMDKGARALRAALWQHILDRDVVSALLALHRQSLNFCACIDWAVNRREHLVRVRCENKNLLPLLASIDFKHWHRRDLFSRKLWVKGGRKSTLVDRGFYNANEADRNIVNYALDVRRGFQSFDNQAGWRWLSNASILVVQSWVEQGRDNAVATNLALAVSNVQRRVPVVALVRLVESAPDGRRHRGLPRYGVSPVLQQLYRLYLVHAAQLWADEGFKAVRAWAGFPGGDRFRDVVDYLEAEGFGQGLPDKNATWASLERRSTEWHRRVAIENMECEASAENKKWEAAVPEIEIEGIACRPLLSPKEMAVEGYEMGHCVASYTGWCIDGGYRVYAMLEPDGTRSTLGLRISRKQVSVEQHRGKCNGPISPLAAAAGKALAARYRFAVSQQIPARTV